jgi:hypothetical protein
LRTVAAETFNSFFPQVLSVEDIVFDILDSISVDPVMKIWLLLPKGIGGLISHRVASKLINQCFQRLKYLLVGDQNSW